MKNIRKQEYKNTRMQKYQNTGIRPLGLVFISQTGWIPIQSNSNHYKIDALIALNNALLQSFLSGLPP